MYAAVTGSGGYVVRPDTALYSQVYHGMTASPADKINTAACYNDSMILSAGNRALVRFKDNGIGTNKYGNSGDRTNIRTLIGADYYIYNQSVWYALHWFFGGNKPLDMSEFPTGAEGHLGRDILMNASGDIVMVGYYNQAVRVHIALPASAKKRLHQLPLQTIRF